MSYLPHFLNPLTAAIAAAIVIPLLLVLYFLKLRRREMPVPSTFLWKKAVQDLQVNAPFQRLRRNLLLLLQLLILGALLLALSRPVANYTPGAGKLAVLLIDRSASMSAADQKGGATRLDEAKRRAKDLVSSLDRNGQASVIAFDDSAEVVRTFTGDAQALRTAIDSIQPTDRPSKLKLAYQLADAQSSFIPEQNRANVKPDVWLYSDGRVLDSADLQLRGELRYEKIGSDVTGNIAVVALSAKRNYEQPTQVQVFARLANFGPAPLTTDVQFSVDNSVRSVASVALPPQRWNDEGWVKAHPGEKDDNYVAKDSVEFTIDLLTSATIKVEQMHKADDAMPADDSAQVVVPPPKALAVLLVTDGNYYLERLLPRLNLKDPATMTPGDYEKDQPGKYDVILFDRYQPTYLPPAGSFVYFAAVPPDSKLKAEMTNDRAVLIPGLMSVLDWKRDHPILRGLSLNKLYVNDPIKLDVPLNAEVLVDGTKTPLVVLYRESARTHLVVAFDILPSTWPLTISFPVFMYNAMQYLAVGSEMDVRASVPPGATPRIPRANLDKAAPGAKSIRLNGPMGSRNIPIPATGDFALPPLDKVGLYQTDPAVPQYEQIAVNLLDENESNLVPVDAPPGNVGTAVASGGGKSRLELWWWIVALGAVPLLLVEWWVYTRRVHL